MSFEIKQEEKNGQLVNVIHIHTASYGATIDCDPETNTAMTVERATEIAEGILSIVLENEKQAAIAEAERLAAEAKAANDSSDTEIMDDFWGTPGV